jgi:DNA polymerase-1
MLINVDVKSLEIVTAAELSGDQTFAKEIREKIDLHEVNRDTFKLGEGKAGRLVAKVLTFRIIYGGSAYSFAHDPDFMGVSTSEKFWQGVIDQYYEKYKGLKKWHDDLLLTVMRTGQIVIPSGRYFPFEKNGYRWPLTIIKNYPVQGFGADLVKLARIEFYQSLKMSGIPALFVGTIHDSLVADSPEEYVLDVAKMMKTSVEKVPALCKQHYGYDFSLPMTCELKIGPNKLDMEEIFV